GGEVPAAQRHPYRLQPVKTCRTRVGGEGDGVDGPSGGADDQIWRQGRLVQRPQHAYLRRSKTAPALEDEGDSTALPRPVPSLPGCGTPRLRRAGRHSQREIAVRRNRTPAAVDGARLA